MITRKNRSEVMPMCVLIQRPVIKFVTFYKFHSENATRIISNNLYVT